MRYQSCALDTKGWKSFLLTAVAAGLIGMLSPAYLIDVNTSFGSSLYSSVFAGLFLAAVALITFERPFTAAVGFALFVSMIIFIGAFTFSPGFLSVVEPIVLGGTVILVPSLFVCFIKVSS